MEKNKTENKLALLPFYFKKIGLLFIILSIVPALIMKLMGIQHGQMSKETFHTITLDALTLGLLFIAWSKDKVEDETTFAIRAKTMMGTFIWAVFYVITYPTIINFLTKSPVDSLTSQDVVMNMLGMYLMMYYLQNMGSNKKVTVR